MTTVVDIKFGTSNGPETECEVACRSLALDERVFVVGVARDVTASRRFQSEIERARWRAAHQERLRSLGQLSAGIAHDFRNTLSTIQGRTERVLSLPDLDPRVQGELAIIESACRSARETVDRIRKISTPEGQLVLAEVDLRTVISDALKFVFTRTPLAVSMTFAPPSQPVVVLGNGDQLREVLVNLLNNAVDAVTPRGNIRVGLDERSGQPTITIADDGAGIPEELRSRIFEPFFTTKGEQGTGLGLSVSQETLHRHGVDIRVDSKPGEGSTFTLIFPKPASLVPATATLQLGQLAVVVVDDDPAIAEMIRDILEDEGHRVSVFSQPSDAANAFAFGSVDLLVTDLDLPGMSGWNLAKRARELQPAIKVGLVTGWPIDTPQAELKARGVDFVLTKPFSVRALYETLDEIRHERKEFPT